MVNNLRSYFPNYLNSDSLFTKMSTLGAPWSSEVGQDMDDAYFTMYSGIKYPSEFVTLHLNPDSEVANSLTIARILLGMYNVPWTKLWEAYQAQYSPIDNFNTKEVVSRTQTNDRTINRTNDYTSSVGGTEKRTSENDGTENINGSTTTDVTTDSQGTSTLQHGQVITRTAQAENFTYGFNSAEEVPTSTQKEAGSDTYSGTDTTTTTDHSVSNSDETTKTDSTTHDTGTIDIASNSAKTDKTVEDTLDTDDEKEDIERTRQGNSGNYSYQELLQQEFELWRWNFYLRVFEDVDRFLTLSVYSPCSFCSSVN